MIALFGKRFQTRLGSWQVCNLDFYIVPLLESVVRLVWTVISCTVSVLESVTRLVWAVSRSAKACGQLAVGCEILRLHSEGLSQYPY